MKKKKRKSVKAHTPSSHRVGRSKRSLQSDSQRKAKKPGKRRTKHGTKYTEHRANRSDVPGFRI